MKKISYEFSYETDSWKEHTFSEWKIGRSHFNRLIFTLVVRCSMLWLSALYTHVLCAQCKLMVKVYINAKQEQNTRICNTIWYYETGRSHSMKTKLYFIHFIITFPVVQIQYAIYAFVQKRHNEFASISNHPVPGEFSISNFLQNNQFCHKHWQPTKIRSWNKFNILVWNFYSCRCAKIKKCIECLFHAINRASTSTALSMSSDVYVRVNIIFSSQRIEFNRQKSFY